MTTDYMEFECMACSKMFSRLWFDISRSYDRVHYKHPRAPDEVEVSMSEGIGIFCSAACLEASRDRVMRDQGVLIPRVRPGIEPIECCAKCAGPVDMSDWHLTFSEALLEEQAHARVGTHEFEYLAVVCKRCAPKFGTMRSIEIEDREPSSSTPAKSPSGLMEKAC